MSRADSLSDFRQQWLPGLVLGTVLYLMYSPVFLTDYLMNDEWYLIGSRQGVREGMKDAFLTYGRGLFGIYSTLIYKFAKYDPFRIQLVRFANFASLVAIALLLFVLLRNMTKSAWFSSL